MEKAEKNVWQNFLLVNPTAFVYALPEGSALHIQNEMATVLGENPILCFSENMECAHLTSIQLFLINLKGTYNGIIQIHRCSDWHYCHNLFSD